VSHLLPPSLKNTAETVVLAKIGSSIIDWFCFIFLLIALLMLCFFENYLMALESIKELAGFVLVYSLFATYFFYIYRRGKKRLINFLSDTISLQPFE
jgi:hypothetical protein